MPAVDTYDPGYAAQLSISVRRQVRRTIYDPTSSSRYYLRAWDSGTGGYVTWGPYRSPTANLTPIASQTTPNYTGVLSTPHVYLERTT